MLKFILKRLLEAIPTLLVLITVSFFMMRFAPGNPFTSERALPPEVLAALQPEAVVPAMLVLAHEHAPTRTTLCAGAGSVEAAHITLTQGAWIGTDAGADERLLARLADVTDRAGELVPANGGAQGAHEVARALAQKN